MAFKLSNWLSYTCFQLKSFNDYFIQPPDFGDSLRLHDLCVSYREKCLSGPGFPFCSTTFKITSYFKHFTIT